ncbi:Na(+)/citrate cotransporter-like [Haliotis cracherodii]|uniref:Na(+)/citrate cotransporter-like n=1 Tax=Haliotis cracherodii TaxID=6455 RepID=UPI0039E92889
MAIVTHLKACWRTLVVVATPLVLSPLILPGTSSVSKCGFSLVLMGVFWLTEALPLPVTALLPVLLFPLLGIVPSKDVSRFYMTDINVLLMGGLCVAMAIEECNLHKRFALRLLLLLGVQPRRLMLGFMLATGVLSMWISNTASTAMMLPVARALFARLIVLKRRREAGKQSREAIMVDSTEHSELMVKEQPEDSAYVEEDTSRDPAVTEDELDFHHLDTESLGLLKALCLCVCYSANCGGVGTLTGSAPQLVLKGQIDSIDGGRGTLTFTSYMVYALPLSAICLVCVWVLLQITCFGFRKTFCCQKSENAEDDKEIRNLIKKDYIALGPLSFAEWIVMIHFIVLVLLWLTRKPGFFTGWSHVFLDGYLSDSVPAVMVTCSLFIFPRRRPNVLFFRRKGDNSEPVSQESILQWSTVSSRFPWGVLLLLGGGFALADACQKSGMSRAVAEQLVFVKAMSPTVAGIVVTLISGVGTEFIANTVVATLLLPIISEVARSMVVHPMYFMLPATIVTSCAFMLPVATPPNAIAFAGGDIRVIDMVKSGFLIKIVTMVCVILSVNTWGMAYFQLHQVPAWFGPVTESYNTSFVLQTVNTTVNTLL